MQAEREHKKGIRMSQVARIDSVNSSYLETSCTHKSAKLIQITPNDLLLRIASVDKVICSESFDVHVSASNTSQISSNEMFLATRNLHFRQIRRATLHHYRYKSAAPISHIAGLMVCRASEWNGLNRAGCQTIRLVHVNHLVHIISTCTDPCVCGARLLVCVSWLIFPFGPHSVFIFAASHVNLSGKHSHNNDEREEEKVAQG